MKRTTFPTTPDLRGLNPGDAEAALAELQRIVFTGQAYVSRRPFRARRERLRWNIYWNHHTGASHTDLNRWARDWLLDQYHTHLDVDIGADLDDGDAESR